LKQIHKHGETSYPEEGAGLLIGRVEGDQRIVESLMELENSREAGARRNRYLIKPEDMLKGEMYATSLGMDVLGVFHSHPDHPNLPSEFDREWALPWYSYLITSIKYGKADETRSWRLEEDRSKFFEETITVS
jgi:proteasome lid subunit RPN8/RPN11